MATDVNDEDQTKNISENQDSNKKE
jgi:hypothetical protein